MTSRGRISLDRGRPAAQSQVVAAKTRKKRGRSHSRLAAQPRWVARLPPNPPNRPGAEARNSTGPRAHSLRAAACAPGARAAGRRPPSLLAALTSSSVLALARGGGGGGAAARRAGDSLCREGEWSWLGSWRASAGPLCGGRESASVPASASNGGQVASRRGAGSAAS